MATQIMGNISQCDKAPSCEHVGVSDRVVREGFSEEVTFKLTYE